MRKEQLLRTMIVTILAIGIATVFALPTVLTITNSFMSAEELAAHYGSVFQGLTSENVFSSASAELQIIPDFVSIKQYFAVLFQSPDYLMKFWNSVLLTLPIVLGQVAMATMAAYAFYRCRGKFSQILFFVYIVLMLMPYQVMLVPNFLVSDWIGLLGSRLAVILPGIFAPFSVFLLTKFMRRIPEALIEAAKIDRTSEWRIFTRICLPQCLSAIFSIAILAFIENWNMVEQALILLGSMDQQPLSVYLSTINSQEIGLAFAVATIYMIPPLFLFLYGEQYLLEGIAHSGSVKG